MILLTYGLPVGADEAIRLGVLLGGHILMVLLSLSFICLPTCSSHRQPIAQAAMVVPLGLYGHMHALCQAMLVSLGWYEHVHASCEVAFEPLGLYGHTHAPCEALLVPLGLYEHMHAFRAILPIMEA